MNIYEQTKVKSLAHYQRMIDWVRTQPMNDPSDMVTLLGAVGETYGGTNCHHCRTFTCMKDVYMECPLLGENGRCCNGLYWNMIHAETWDEWLAVALKVQEYIKNSRTDYQPSVFSRVKARIKNINTFVGCKVQS